VQQFLIVITVDKIDCLTRYFLTQIDKKLLLYLRR